MTKRPRWVVVKISNFVNMQKRNYYGELTFQDVKRYLSVFASKKEFDRKVDTGIGSKKIRDQTLKVGSKVYGDDFDFDDVKSNFNYQDDIQIVHVTDSFTMNYPNLVVF